MVHGERGSDSRTGDTVCDTRDVHAIGEEDGGELALDDDGPTDLSGADEGRIHHRTHRLVCTYDSPPRLLPSRDRGSRTHIFGDPGGTHL